MERNKIMIHSYLIPGTLRICHISFEKLSFYTTPSAHSTFMLYRMLALRATSVSYMVPRDWAVHLSIHLSIHDLPGVSCMSYYSTASPTPNTYMHVCQGWATRYQKCLNFRAYLRMFSGVSYGLQMSKLVICPTREKLRQTETKRLHYLRFSIG